ncbi:hypothetical protein FACS1894147_12550 [Spirochaetia bacterium]|nr:hypothetical protein FACS1894147_12550 [Spirochaetia bacterium]
MKVSVEVEALNKSVSLVIDRAIALIDLFRQEVGEAEAEEYQEEYIFPLENALAELNTLAEKIKN